jgi:TrmH family RNA methyltransferase
MPKAGHLHVVLVSPRNPLNIGAAARAMSNFGFSSLRLVNPYEVAFRNARSAVGGAHLLKTAVEYKSVADAIADCSLVVGTTAVRHREVQHPLKMLQLAAPVIRKKLASGNVALLFGTEKFGLSIDDLSHCDWLLRIPTTGNISMNLGQAVAVCLYEMAREAIKNKSREKIESANAGQMDRLTAMLFEALSESGYVKPKTEASTEQKLRRMIRRLKVSKKDAEVVQGMLRQINWKIGGAGRNRTDA